MTGRTDSILPAHLAVIGANVIYGINYVVAKGIMPDFMQPRMIILLRVAGATMVFWLAASWYPRQKVALPDMARIAICALFGIAINQVMFFEGLNLTTPINAAIIMVGTPILVLLFSHFILKERITGYRLLGIILGFAGAAYLIISGGGPNLGSNTILGNFFVFINASSYGLFLVLIKPLMKKYRPITLMKWLFTFGLVYILPVSAHLTMKTDFASIPSGIWLSVIYVILFTTVLAYFLNNYSLKNISPTMNSAYIYLQPFLAALVALLAGKDRITFTAMIAAVLIFAGVYFVNFAPGRLPLKLKK